MDKISEVKGNVDTVKEFTQSSNNYSDTNTKTVEYTPYTGNSTYTMECSNIELDSVDVKELLEYIDGIKENMNTDDMETVIVDYSAVANDENYREQILSRLPDYTEPVTFVVIKQVIFSADEAQEEMDYVQSIVYNNLFDGGSVFENVQIHKIMNSPDTGNITIAITFS